VPDLFHRRGQLRGQLATTPGHDEGRRGQGLFQVGQQTTKLLGTEPAGFPEHHHPAISQKRWRLARQHHGVEIDLVAPKILDRQPGIVTGQFADQPAHLFGHQGRVVPVDQPG
jgi:hypothetical protein